METYRFTCQVDDDGMLTVKIPVNLRNADVEVAVVIQLLKQHIAPIEAKHEDDKFPHTYDNWTPADDEQLLALLDDGLSIREIAVQLKRRPRAIESRVLRLERSLTSRKETD